MSAQSPPPADEPAGIEPPPQPPPFVTAESVPGLVRMVRRRADKSQRELAKAAGVAPSTVAKLETGDLTPSLTTLVRILGVANLNLVATDLDGIVAEPMAIWDDTRDGGGKLFPAHLDLIIDPRLGEWWADKYGLARPPETYHRDRAYRDAKRALSQWAVRVQQFRNDPMPEDPDSPLWRRRRPASPTDRDFT
ncbi:MAG TPA: helix-turn-helix transcriptional regulator [Jiangellales bacterium]|nr:helix-turn-helix transcriptional regulator [Jiangellales bacterium]